MGTSLFRTAHRSWRSWRVRRGALESLHQLFGVLPTHPGHPRRGKAGDVPLHRNVLQPAAKARQNGMLSPVEFERQHEIYSGGRL